MVDAIVSFTVQKLGEFISQEIVFLQDVKDGVEWLKKELEWMQCFLKDAEQKQDDDDRIRKWISEIRDIAYDAENIIDNFILKVEGAPRKGFLASVKKCSCIFNKKIDLHNIGKEIEALKKRVNDISSRREAYGIKNIGDIGEGTGTGANRLRELRRNSAYANEGNLVGFEDITSSLVDELLKEEPQCFVISIFGMGGLGKTTLAKKLYHHSKVEGRFKYRGWVYVSQEYRNRYQLLQAIIRSFKQFSNEEKDMLEKMTEEELDRHFHEFLKGSRYLVVIDDVWHKETWKILRTAFPINNNGSRVIITTRIKAVAERSDERSYVHELRFLSSYESWELFCEKAFPIHSATGCGDTCRCPSSLEMVGREMVEKCRGLPLAIIVLGGLLSGKKQPHEWETVKRHLWRDLRNDSIHIEAILALSFNDLPFQLKPCFLYFGLFPEDFEINAEKLIRLWVAEGFIAPRDQETLEEVGEDWLNELVDRSLIQVAKRNWRRITACRVHDLLRDLAVAKAKELIFLHIYDENVDSAPSFTNGSSCRRQSAHCRIERYVSATYSNPCLQTLLVFNPDLEPNNVNIKPLESIDSRFRLLRVLDLHNITFSNSEDRGKSLPADVMGKLIHLKYLGLRGARINKLPSCIVNLQALQTLDAFSDIVVRLPSDIGKLTQLRHLIGNFGGLLGVDHLTNLLTLKFVDMEDWSKINPLKLINLRELHIRPKLNLEEPLHKKSNQSGEVHVKSKETSSTHAESDTNITQKEFTLESVANLKKLESLSVELCSSMHFGSFQPLSHCRHLLQLMIDGKIESLPEQMREYLPNLKYLQLRRSQLTQDPMPTLEKFRDLMILDLQSNDLKKLTCTAGGFPRLQVLKLYGFRYLEELEVAETAMPMLKALDIDMCTVFSVPHKLSSIPDAKKWNRDWDWVNPHKY